MTADPSAPDYSLLRSLVVQFLAGDNSWLLVRQLQSELVVWFGEEDDTPGERMLHRMALYAPGGGPYLHSDEEMIGHFQRFLTWLDRTIAEQPKRAASTDAAD
jgi:hypothetical protein